MIKLLLQLPFGISLRVKVQRSPDLAEIASAVWAEQYQEPPYEAGDAEDCECP